MKVCLHRVIIVAFAMLSTSLGSGCGGPANEEGLGNLNDVAPNQPKSQAEYLQHTQEQTKNTAKPKR